MKTPRHPFLVGLAVVIAASIALPLIPSILVAVAAAVASIGWERDIRRARADWTEDR